MWDEDDPGRGEIRVSRSVIDPHVWVCYDSGAADGDLSSFFAQGRIRAVKRYAELEFGCGEPIRWVRADPSTWVMKFV